MKSLPSQQMLNELLSYDAETGELVWRARGPHWPGYAGFNAQFAGTRALSGSNTLGAPRGRLLGQQVYAHRVIFKMIYGFEPEQIDHINGDRSDNRACNLRAAEYSTNMKNKARYRNNLSGHHNIAQTKRGTWRVRVKSAGRYVISRKFPTLEQAIEARDAALASSGFHPNHGRAA